MTDFDSRTMREACGSFATGVTVITTSSDEGDHGMTANAFMSVSLDPPLISISLDRNARMLGRIRASRRYAVNVLADDMEALAWHFAGRHNPELAGVLERREGLPVVPGAASVFLAEVAQEVEAGDHTLFIGRVTSISRCPEAAPLLFCGGKFHRLPS